MKDRVSQFEQCSSFFPCGAVRKQVPDCRAYRFSIVFAFTEQSIEGDNGIRERNYAFLRPVMVPKFAGNASPLLRYDPIYGRYNLVKQIVMCLPQVWLTDKRANGSVRMRVPGRAT